MTAAAAATRSIRWKAATSPSGSDVWRTPDALFRALDQEFAFTVDAAADDANAKCDESMVVVFRPYRIGEGHIRTQPTFPGFER